MADTLQELTAWMGRVPAEVGEVTGQIAQLQAPISSLHQQLQRAQEQLHEWKATIEARTRQLTDHLHAEAARLHEEQQQTQEAIVELDHAISEVRAMLQDAIQAGAGRIGQLEERTEAGRGEQEQAGVALLEALEAVQQSVEDGADRVEEAVDGARDSAQRLEDGIGGLHKSAEGAFQALNQEVAARAQETRDEAEAHTGRWAEELEQFEGAVAGLGDLMGSSSGEMQRSMEDFLQQKVKEVLERSVEGLKKELAEAGEQITRGSSELGEVRDMLEPLWDELEDLMGHAERGSNAVRHNADKLGVS